MSVIGIDVSKARLDVFDSRTDQLSSCSNDEEGCRELVAALTTDQPKLVVVEASGGYERLVVASLAAAGIAVALVNPRQVRDFAKAAGKLAKTDAIDARVISLFGQKMEPRPSAMESETQQLFALLVERRRQIVEMIVAEKNRFQQAPLVLRPQIQAHLDWLQKHLKEQDKDIQKQIENSDELRPKAQLLRSMTAIGPVVTATLLAELPELGRVSKKEIASLAGLAPFAHDSGQMRGVRRISGGRAKVRRVLYMAAIVAIGRNQQIKTFYEHLLSRGKAKKTALTAVMRKLLVIANAMLRNQMPWQMPAATLTT